MGATGAEGNGVKPVGGTGCTTKTGMGKIASDRGGGLETRERSGVAREMD